MDLDKIKFALLHCTNIYPTPPELVRLQAMCELKKSFPDADLCVFVEKKESGLKPCLTYLTPHTYRAVVGGKFTL